jgi:TonB family protein
VIRSRLAERVLDRRWVPELLGALGGREAFQENPDCASVCPGDSTRRETVELRFGKSKRSPVVILQLDQGVGFVPEREGAWTTRCLHLGDRHGAILAALRRALEDERLLQGVVPCPPPDSAAAADSTGSPPGPTAIVRVDVLPEVAVSVPPVYPEDARRLNVSGPVIVQALVSADGEVLRTRVIDSIRLLDGAAVRAVEQWRFTPAMRDGRPVAVWVAVPVRFRLD